MTMLHRFVLATAAALFAGGLMSTGAEAKCVRAGAQATMLTEDLAKYSATVVLKNSIALKKGARARGPVVVKCSGGPILPTCTARQRVCA